MSDSSRVVPAATAYPPELEGAEDDLIVARRRACMSGDAMTAQRIGFGLSGGGIRSATFCLGVFQALAKKPQGKLLERIDYLSTVSGGGYFGSFLGRLYSRKWIRNAADVANVLRDISPPIEGQGVFRYLRDNGRYLAPRGSGDVLTMIAITLRNWAAVQTVLIIAALTAFVALQYASLWVPTLIHAVLSVIGLINESVRDIGAKSFTHLSNWWPPNGPIWWSGWFLLLFPILLLWIVPTSWAYWVIGQPLSRKEWWRRSDIMY